MLINKGWVNGNGSNPGGGFGKPGGGLVTRGGGDGLERPGGQLSMSIPSEILNEEAPLQFFGQHHVSIYVPDPIELEDHIPMYIPEPKHPEDLVLAEDEAPTPPLPPFFLSPRIRPPRTRAAMAQMRATAPSTYHLLLPSGTPPLLPIQLPAPSTSRRADIPEADSPPQKRLLLTTPRPSCELGSSVAATNETVRTTMSHRVDYSRYTLWRNHVFEILTREMKTALDMVNIGPWKARARLNKH
ncbi:hypothetical protein Tco_0955567 [Tanacetum coccineum]|uniref:Uncharacterized protein n=1 Tax=Tanacetum coccineum TaxID=301880 RepID=A0ABQ5E7K7_9ASTR